MRFDPNNRLWIGTSWGGSQFLVRLGPDFRPACYLAQADLQDPPIASFLGVDSQDRLWFGTGVWPCPQDGGHYLCYALKDCPA